MDYGTIIREGIGWAVTIAVGLGIWRAMRRIKTRQAAAVSSAHIEGIEAGRAAVLAEIGGAAAGVVVHNHNGDSLRYQSPDQYAELHQHDDYELDHEHAGPGGFYLRPGGGDDRVVRGVPVGRDRNGHDRDARRPSSTTLSDDVLRKLSAGNADASIDGRGAGR